MDRTIEQKVADAILQKDIASVEIGGKTYSVAPPTIATLILVSEIISTLPVVDATIDKDKRVYSVLQTAKHYTALGDIIAILILGAKGLTETIEEEYTESYFFGLFKRKKVREVTLNKKRELSKIILENTTPSELWNLIIARLSACEIGDFFAITTSLSEVNLLKATKEVVN